MDRKIALVGSAPSSMRAAPWGDPAWEIWGCSPGLYGYAQKIDAWFELHVWEPGQPWFSPEYCQWLTNLPNRGAVLWMGAPDPDAPEYGPAPIAGAKVLPHKEIIEKYDPCRWFCTSSLFWMMAMAVEQKPTTIGLWGIDMAASEEYEMQRAGIHYMAYRAREAGVVEVATPPESDLFTPRFRYGIDEWTHHYKKVRARDAELSMKEAEAVQAAKDAETKMWFMRGARDDLKYNRDTWFTTTPYNDPLARWRK